MTITIHNPHQYMAALRQIIAQCRKRVRMLIGAGAPANLIAPDDRPLIQVVAGLTDLVLTRLAPTYGNALVAIKAELDNPNIELILSRVRSLAAVIGATQIHELDGAGYKTCPPIRTGDQRQPRLDQRHHPLLSEPRRTVLTHLSEHDPRRNAVPLDRARERARSPVSQNLCVATPSRSSSSAQSQVAPHPRKLEHRADAVTG
jgi:hypothetical protein